MRTLHYILIALLAAALLFFGARLCGAAETVRYSAADVAKIRDRAGELTQIEGDPNARGWSKSPVDPTKMMAAFPKLRLREGFVLRSYVFREGGNGNGVVWAMPAAAEFPEPADCPKLENQLLKAPKPFDALDDAMDAVEGDGSPASYLQASLLRRELKAFGASWHGVTWGVHTVLDNAPWKQLADENADPLHRSRTPEQKWKWSGPRPTAWSPTVTVDGDRTTVTFYTFCGREKERIWRHTDVYRTGKYRPRVEEAEIAAGIPGFMF